MLVTCSDVLRCVVLATIRSVLETLGLRLIISADVKWSQTYKPSASDYTSAYQPAKRLARAEQEDLEKAVVPLLDQIVCATADAFVGTSRSLFTQVIEEERRLRHKHPASTTLTFPSVAQA